MRPICALFVAGCLVLQFVCAEDLYSVLGVKKSASHSEIKKAYKALAREWHPDKNQEEGANEKFMKINEAYETLSDETRRREYDQFGTTSAQAQDHGQQQGFRQGFGSFEQFFSQGPHGFSFNFGGRGHDSSVHKYRVQLRTYQSKILPESQEKPYLLYAYSDFCYSCMEVELLWDKIVSDMDAIGLGVGTIQAQLDHALASKCRITSVPTLMVVIGGKIRYFSGRYTLPEIRNFVRNSFPSGLVTELSNANYHDFLNGWRDNKVRSMFFDNKKEPSLRFMAAAFQNRERVMAGYVNTAKSDTEGIRLRFGIASQRETILMFGEDVDNPTATLTMNSLPRSTIDEVMESNKYLQLPRLSSQPVYDQLCPAMSSVKRKKLCVILLTRDVVEHDAYRDTFRQYAVDHEDESGRVHYTYVFEDTQSSFVNKLTRGEGIVNETNLKVAVLWRRDRQKLQFDWLEDGWPLDVQHLQRSRRKLHHLVDWFLQSSQIMPHMVEFTGELTNENAEFLLYRIGRRLQDWYEAIYERVFSLDEVTVITSLVTIGCVLLLGFFLTTMANLEEERVSHERPSSRTRSSKGSSPSSHHMHAAAPPPQPQEYVNTATAAKEVRPTVYMHEFHSETFEPLIQKSLPGVRALIILVDYETKDKLIQQFAKCVVPYSRSEAFTFSFMQVELHLNWFRHLLEETLDFKRNLQNINKKNCIGTVLSINGPRKYYCMYHAQQEQIRRRAKYHGQKPGSFVGLNDSDSDSENEMYSKELLFEADLLLGFPMWMERLVEGSLRRFRVDYWPEMEAVQEEMI